ncbi:MAG: hypothetical protein EA361_17190, partial [Bacteroidetes bacterium]
MKKLTFLLFVVQLCHTIPSEAQTGTPFRIIDDFSALDSTRFIVTYSLDFFHNPDKPGAIDSDIIILEIGYRLSKSYSYGLFKHDSIATTINKRGGSSAPNLQKAVPPMEVFKNHPFGKNTVIHRSPFGRLIFLYEDEINIQWEILHERK